MLFFFSISANKAALFNILCLKWSLDENLKTAVGSTCLYLGGGFKNVTENELSKDTVNGVSQLQSTQNEPDTIIILYSPSTTFSKREI